MYKMLFLTALCCANLISAVTTESEKKEKKRVHSHIRVIFTHHPELQDLYQDMIKTPEYKAYQEARIAYRKTYTGMCLDPKAFHRQYYQACKKQILAYQKTKEYKLYQRMRKVVQSQVSQETCNRNRLLPASKPN